MLAQSYLALNDSINALKYLYVAKDNISPTNDSYLNTLYNIGLFEYFNKTMKALKKAYKELLRISPDDFLTYSKLIQVYYGVKDYDKAEPYRQKLYQAQSNKKLEGYLGDMFCFDQFYWNGKLVQAFERYETGDTKLYYKHLFFWSTIKEKLLWRFSLKILQLPYKKKPNTFWVQILKAPTITEYLVWWRF